MKNSLVQWFRHNRFTSEWAALLALRKKTNYLKEVGWFRSFKQHLPIDIQEVTLPWYTYGAIDFLSKRINPDMAVFEYGSGNSTFWWASHVTRVVSCEHDRQWYDKLKPCLPNNVEYHHFEFKPSGEYSKAILQYDHEFDVIVIDGKDRVLSAKNSLTALKGTGIIIWDNSDRDQYKDGYAWLIKNSFKQLDFSGMGPVNAYGWCTSIFYRSVNCLGI